MVTVAVTVVAQVRSATLNPGVTGIWSAGIVICQPSWCRAFPVIILHPFPDIAGHIVKPKAIWPIAVNRCGLYPAISAGILMREPPLPSIHGMFPLRHHDIAPRELFPRQATTRGEFPFAFPRKAKPRPDAISKSVKPGDLDDSMIGMFRPAAIGSFRRMPARTPHGPPPGCVCRIFVMSNGGACKKMKHIAPPFPLGDGDVPGICNEIGEILIAYCKR